MQKKNVDSVVIGHVFRIGVRSV